MLSSSVSAFDLLLARPPTPPRDFSADGCVVSFFDKDHEPSNSGLKSSSELMEPSGVQASSPPVEDSIATISKKVDFSPYPTIHRPTRPFDFNPLFSGSPKLSPSARGIRPAKSILKPSSPATPDDSDRRISYFTPGLPGSFEMMLESVLRRLEGPPGPSRLDAYLSLNGALRAHTNLPEIRSIAPKMGLITKLLARDMTWKADDSSMDANIVVQALQSTLILMSSAELYNAFDSEFKAFLVDRSITVMQQDNVPKQITKLQLNLLAHQHFSSLIVTSSRAEKIITALQNIESRCGGNTTIITRLNIYQRLLEQAPSVLLARMQDWFGHNLHCMLSNIKDIRVRAIEICEHAGLVLGSQPAATKNVIDMLEFNTESEKPYYDHIESQLLRMASDRQLGSFVPQIWSTITLFFRSKRRPFESWPRSKSWLLVLQRCLNSNHMSTRQQAYLAWSKLTFAIMPDSSTSKSLMSMFKVPIATGLAKRGNDKYANHHRMCALDCLYMLLHYFLRPGLTHEDYDAAWTSFVEPLLSQLLSGGPEGSEIACDILRGLSTSSPGVWNANAVFASMPLVPEELPKLEQRWMRSRLPKALAILQPTLLQYVLESSAAQDYKIVAWSSFMQLIAEAGSQEVKASNDAKEAIASLTSLFLRLWTKCLQSDSIEKLWLLRYVSLIQSTISIIGPTIFNEEFLVSSNDETIAVAPTPSSRRPKAIGSIHSPLNILFGMFYTDPQVSKSAKTQNAAVLILQCQFLPSSRALAKFDLLGRSLRAWVSKESLTTGASINVEPIEAILDTALMISKTDELITTTQDSQNLGNTLRSAVNILAMVLQNATVTTSTTILERIVHFYQAICTAANMGAGPGSVVEVVMEPTARSFLAIRATLDITPMFTIASCILQNAVWPADRETAERAHKALWGVGLVALGPKLFDPFEHVYSMIITTLVSLYENAVDKGSDKFYLGPTFLVQAADFFKSCPPEMVTTSLRKVQTGFIIWLEDKSQKTADVDVSLLISNAWQKILDVVQTVPRNHRSTVKHLESLFVAAFSSPHQSVVGATTEFWNDFTRNEDTLEYTAQLKAVLSVRMLDMKLNLPNFPQSDDGFIASLPEYYEFPDADTEQGQVPLESNHENHHHYAQHSESAHTSKDITETTNIVSQLDVQRNGACRSREHESETLGTITPRANLRFSEPQIAVALVPSSPAETALDVTAQNEDVAQTAEEVSIGYPDLPSSRVIHSIARPPDFVKRLDFSIEKDRDLEGTPRHLRDSTVLSSDGFVMSPTPSNKTATPRQAQLPDEFDLEILPDPPSSPPQAEQDMIDLSGDNLDTWDPDFADIPTAPELGIESYLNHEKENQKSAAMEADEAMDEDLNLSAFDEDLLLDSTLIAAQLQQEQAAADEGKKQDNIHSNAGLDTIESAEVEDRVALIDHVDVTRLVESSPPREEDDSVVEESTAAKRSDVDLVDLVRDSFVGSSTAAAAAGPDLKHQIERTVRKRKRTTSTLYSTKKQKVPSPLKRILNYFRNSQEEEVDVEEKDNDELGEEIIVASSRPTADANDGEKTKNTLVLVEIPVVSQNELEIEGEMGGRTTANTAPQTHSQVTESSESVPVAPEPAKAPKQGRPKARKMVETKRESTDSNAATPVTGPRDTRISTRSQSRLATKGNTLDDDTSHVLREAQPPTTVRRTRRTVTPGVLVPKELEKEVDVDMVTLGEAPSKTAEETGPNQGVTIIEQDHGPTSATVMDQMRAALSSLKNISLTSAEQRAFCDLLFELQKETHEAAGRKQNAT